MKPDRILKETDAYNMDDKINPSWNWVRHLSSLRIMLVSQSSSSKVKGYMNSSYRASLSTTFNNLLSLHVVIKVFSVESYTEKQVCGSGAVSANKWAELYGRANKCERSEDKHSFAKSFQVLWSGWDLAFFKLHLINESVPTFKPSYGKASNSLFPLFLLVASCLFFPSAYVSPLSKAHSCSAAPPSQGSGMQQTQLAELMTLIRPSLSLFFFFLFSHSLTISALPSQDSP